MITANMAKVPYCLNALFYESNAQSVWKQHASELWNSNHVELSRSFLFCISSESKGLSLQHHANLSNMQLYLASKTRAHNATEWCCFMNTQHHCAFCTLYSTLHAFSHEFQRAYLRRAGACAVQWVQVFDHRNSPGTPWWQLILMHPNKDQ